MQVQTSSRSPRLASVLLHSIPRGHASCCSTGLHAPFPVAQPDFDWTARSCPMSTGMALCPVEGRMKATGISTQRAIVATPYAFHLEIGKTRTVPHFSYRLEPAVRLNQNDTVRQMALRFVINRCSETYRSRRIGDVRLASCKVYSVRVSFVDQTLSCTPILLLQIK